MVGRCASLGNPVTEQDFEAGRQIAFVSDGVIEAANAIG